MPNDNAASAVSIALIVEPPKNPGLTAYWAAAWRDEGRQVKRRLGPAWVVPAGSADAKPNGEIYGQAGTWVQRRGRAQGGALDRRAAFVRAEEVVERTRAERARQRELERSADRSFRALAREWQVWAKRHRHKPSTVRDVGYLLAEPGVEHKRGGGQSAGHVMAVLGDLAAVEVKSFDVDRTLRKIARAGGGARTVNKTRTVLVAIFSYGCDDRRDWGLTANAAARTDKLPERSVDHVQHFEVEQVEAIARAAEAGAARTDRSGDHNGVAATGRAQEDAQLAETIRVAAYTGLRQGELVALRWRDIKFGERVIHVTRALSAGEELSPKSNKARTVPLADQSLAALDRLSRRANFTGPDDYVLCGPAGDRLDPSALRRRYKRARDAAGAPDLPFHGLRHTAASLMVRRLDPVSVQAILGHASIQTTQRYLHARRAAELADDVTAALTPSNPIRRDDQRAVLTAPV